MPNTPALRAHLAEARRPKIARIHSDHRRTFCRAISLQRTDAKAILESQRERLRQLFRTYYHVLQAAKVLRQAPPRVRLQKCRRRKEKRNAIIPYQFADRYQIERAGMKRDTNTHH